MTEENLFTPGGSTGLIPVGDTAREAVASLRGYAYQVLAATLAWLDVAEKGHLFLEVAEDYATMAEQALSAVQVKDTADSGSVTLNSKNVRDAVTSFVDLVEKNPDLQVSLRYFTTSEISTEQAIAERPLGMAGLEFWRRAAAGADPSPLRQILESDKFPESVQRFVKSRDDDALRRDMLQRVHWDCGKPDFKSLRQELEERLVVVGRDKFGLAAPESRRLADILVFQVLKKSIVKTRGGRVLTRSDLYVAVDAATRVSVPRGSVDTMAQIASGLVQPLGSGAAPSSMFSIEEMGWLIDGSTLPNPRNAIARDAVESVVAGALQQFGAGVLFGASGLGKSLVARSVAKISADTFAVADFRDIDADEVRYRLNVLLARLGGLQASVLILEDLNHLEAPGVALTIGRLTEALRRRDKTALVTCYRRPSVNAVATAGLDQLAIVECPYFSKDEVNSLIHLNGGGVKSWGPLAYVAGACGHPQLTHAFVLGMSTRGWPEEEIDSVIVQGLSSDDIDSIRDAARSNLVSALPVGARVMLYRLSLSGGRFSRSLAIDLGALPPPIAQPGECLDQLIGPWIEAVSKDTYRVSPLANTFGREMLAADEQKKIHETIAVRMLRTRAVDAGDVDTILIHALAAGSEYSIALVAQGIVTADQRTVELLAENLVVLPHMRADAPIVPESPVASGMLRLAQFKLLVAKREGDKAARVAEVLFDEVDRVSKGELKRALEGLVYATVLSTAGVANYLDDWIDLLQHFRALVQNSELLQSMIAGIEGHPEAGGENAFAALFAIGSANLASVERLEHVIDELNQLSSSERETLLVPIDKSVSDYSLFVSGPWARQKDDETFDALDAAARYERMVRKTKSWGNRALSLQFWVARAVMLDEYEGDKDTALAILDEAVASLGNAPVLARARAKVYWRDDQHREALEILRGIADQVGGDNVVERAFALREAAISAAKCDEWPQAERWFLEAQKAALAAQTNDMAVMALGLGTDAAVAALEAGSVPRALSGLAKVLAELPGIDPDSSLRAAYCHRVVRHTVLWAQSQIRGRSVQIAGEPILMQPGTCSNPEPLPAIKTHPLGPIDLAWYMLAESEMAAGVDLGILANLPSRLEEGPISMMEFGLRFNVLEKDIDDLAVKQFANHLMPFVEAGVYLSANRSRLRGSFDALSPERGEVPSLDRTPPFPPKVEQVAAEAILAFCAQAVAAGEPEKLSHLNDALEREFSGVFPGAAVFGDREGAVASLGDFEKVIVQILEIVRAGDHLEPDQFWGIGLRLFEWVERSNFKNVLLSRLAQWLRAKWKRIVADETFRLHQPHLTVPTVEEVLGCPENSRSFVASLLLATAPAVGVQLDSEYEDSLKRMTRESESVTG